jgi:hypothetical protein
MRACHSSAVHCKLFGETLICIGVSSANYSSINHRDVGLYRRSDMACLRLGRVFGLQGQGFGGLF